MDRKLAAIVFTDIADFTTITAEDEENAFELINLQRELFQPIVQKFDGEWLKEIGDGLLLCFSSSKKAISCAIALHKEAINVDLLNIRIGIHQGDVIISKSDVIGDDVNIASRIEPLSAVGGIAVSEKVLMDLMSSPEYRFKYMGIPELKGVKQNIKVFALSSHSMQIPDRKFKTRNENPDSGKETSKISILATVVFTLITFFSYPYIINFIGVNDYDAIKVNNISIMGENGENRSQFINTLKFGIEKRLIDLGKVNLVTSDQNIASIGMLDSEPLLLNTKIEQELDYTAVSIILKRSDGTIYDQYYKQYRNREIEQVVDNLINLIPMWTSQSMLKNIDASGEDIDYNIDSKYPLQYYELMSLINSGDILDIQNAIIKLDELSIVDDAKWIQLMTSEAYTLGYMVNNSKRFLDEAASIIEQNKFNDQKDIGYSEYVKSLISFLDDDIEKASKHIKQAIKIDRDEKRYRELHHRIRSKILKRMANDD